MAGPWLSVGRGAGLVSAAKMGTDSPPRRSWWCPKLMGDDRSSRGFRHHLSGG
jgi:hypothetical protein